MMQPKLRAISVSAKELTAASERIRSNRERIDAIEKAIISELPAGQVKIIHHFSKGVYGREMHIEQGTVLTGKIHKYENFNIMSKGKLSILMEDGTVQLVKAPFHVVSPPGTRRVAYAHEDTVWTTIHGTSLSDVDEIERFFVAQNPEEFQLFCEQQLALEGS